jgi:glycosyltransferase involved in cell wall biosynthesis
LQRIFNPREFDFSLSLQRTGQQDACLAPGDHLGFLKALRRPGRKPKDVVQINLDKISFANSRYIFPCSEMVRQNLVELYGVPESKMTTLLPPLNTQKFNLSLKDKRQELRAKYNMSPDKKTFVIVSTAHRRKGVPILKRAFRRLTDFPVELKIVGKPTVRTKLPNVEYLGYLSEVNEIFTAADFSIHPAKYEPFGQVISESLACGTPVLISENTGWSRNLPENYGNVVSGFRPRQWAEAIKEIAGREFLIPKDFAQIHELSLDDHMTKMLSTVGLLS